MAGASFRVIGLCAAPFTPFQADGAVDYESIDLHVRDLGRRTVALPAMAVPTSFSDMP
jgi:dihydrodipicolinate synthase/N-acetylneuraminate lyase